MLSHPGTIVFSSSSVVAASAWDADRVARAETEADFSTNDRRTAARSTQRTASARSRDDAALDEPDAAPISLAAAAVDAEAATDHPLAPDARSPDVCSSPVVAGGPLDCLPWARENGCPWEDRTCAAAADGGHLERLRYARANIYPRDERTDAVIECHPRSA